MPITKSAKKSLKRSEVLRERNSAFKLAMKNTMKLVRKAIEKGQKETLPSLLQNAYSAIDKAARRNILHKNNAARKKSMLAKLIETFKA